MRWDEIVNYEIKYFSFQLTNCRDEKRWDRHFTINSPKKRKSEVDGEEGSGRLTHNKKIT